MLTKRANVFDKNDCREKKNAKIHENKEINERHRNFFCNIAKEIHIWLFLMKGSLTLSKIAKFIDKKIV